MSKNEITVVNDIYTDRQIMSGNVFMVQSLDGDELRYDQLNATLDLSAVLPTIFRPKDADGMVTTEGEIFGVRPRISVLVFDPSTYTPGAVVLYKHNGTLVGKYYMASIERVGKTQYKIDCVSPIGLLAKSQHYGGIYNGVSFPDLLAEIIGGVVPFTVSLDLADQVVYGWLPVASRRENLHQTLFAMGAAAQKDENGDLYIGPLYDDLYTDLPGSRIYSGGSIHYPNPATRVSVVEHAYIALSSDKTTTLFEGDVAAEKITTPAGSSVSGALVLFDVPMHDLTIQNGTILESGVNYAVLGAAGGCTLTGKEYTHTTREIIRPETATNNDPDNTYRVENATLVSVVNSENVASRVSSYYGSAKKINLGIVVNNERAGAAVQFEDPFGDPTKGIITSMDINMSNTLKADTEVVADYRPGNAGNFYTNLDKVTESGSWTVPSGVTKVRVVLIGGGDGGSCGKSGESGTVYGGYHGTGGVGGFGGAGGQPGKVYVATISVTEGQIFTVVVGAGGAGAKYGGTPGAGEASKFGSYSSNSGYAPELGYISTTIGEVYALVGENGVPGGAGYSGNKKEEKETVTYDGLTWTAGDYGQTDGYLDESGDEPMVTNAHGGGGGGAAVGFDGENGADGKLKYEADDTVTAIGGAGGDGATPIPAPDGIIPGSGGTGGHGGGGGGGGGSAGTDDLNNQWEYGANGAGGKGGTGGNGAPGIVLIYY